ncbi:hypothetical protein [Streptomyces caniscabiei]|uniref:hypothetical protein n=1 Tax=Streptomyces caniscabiei TaxID=2746961 RepID=UPI001872EA41|nr:hypothetical protein [Streptomyces caniscabiei]MBE4796159.1 hypothetical protein [Streptomyces caniscabiei]MDX2944467.1 hypothetical protein [Streptomyces caniscabiei]
MATFVIRAEIEIDGVRYTHHYGIPARSWEVADDVMRAAFREGARDGLAQHLAETLPIKITEVGVPDRPS